MTEWSAYVAYKCRDRTCQDDCINHVDAPCTRNKLCRPCYRVADLEDLPEITHHLPESATKRERVVRAERGRLREPRGTGASGERPSKGGPEGDPPSQRESPAEGRERERGSGAESRRFYSFEE